MTSTPQASPADDLLLDSCIEAWFDDSINALASDNASFFSLTPEEYKAECREAMQRVLSIARPAIIEECARVAELHGDGAVTKSALDAITTAIRTLGGIETGEPR